MLKCVEQIYVVHIHLLSSMSSHCSTEQPVKALFNLVCSERLYIYVLLYREIYLLSSMKKSLIIQIQTLSISQDVTQCQLLHEAVNQKGDLLLLNSPISYYLDLSYGFIRCFQNSSVTTHSESQQDPTENKQYMEVERKFGQKQNSFQVIVQRSF